LLFWGNDKKKAKKAAPVSLRKRQPTREERIRAHRNRRLFIFATIFLIAAGSVFYAHKTGAVYKFIDYSKAEMLRITSNAGFKVNEILVSGREEIDKKELLGALTIKRNMPIFDLDIQGSKDAIEKMSWVKGVTISRILPDKVRIDLDERKPAALWQLDHKVSLVDSEGYILDTNDMDKWQHLPLIVGKGSIESLPDLVTLLKAEPFICDRLVSVTRVGERRWNFNLDNGIIVKLPETDVEFALRKLVTIEQEKRIFEKNIKIIDLRKPERMVVELAKPGENVSLNIEG